MERETTHVVVTHTDGTYAVARRRFLRGGIEIYALQAVVFTSLDRALAYCQELNTRELGELR